MRTVAPLLMSAIIFLIAKDLHAQTNIFPSTGSAGIGTTTPDASSLLDMVSTTQGVLVPRMTQAQRNAIVSPATGLLIYQTTNTPGFYYYNGSGWTALAPKAKGWSLTGNSGTNPAVNFIGTTDAQPLIIKVNNQNAGLVGSGNNNTAFGYLTLNVNTGQNNTANGFSALSSNTIGSVNTAIGMQALSANTTGSSNTAIGAQSLASNTTGGGNTATGTSALLFNTTGYDNTASGYEALVSNTTGYQNTAGGMYALAANIDGNNNVATGFYALYGNTSGSYNTATGAGSLSVNTTGTNNTATGSDALHSNTAGYENTAIGKNALYENTNGNGNTAGGYYALTKNTQGVYNTAIGIRSLYFNTIGSSNTAVGEHALEYNTLGTGNAANGSNALLLNSTGNYNTANGQYALSNNTIGINNSANGYKALRTNVDGSYNTCLGDSADVASASLKNATAIGSHSLVSSSNSLVLGSIAGVNGAASSVNVGIGVGSPTSSLHIKGQGNTSATSSLKIENSSAAQLLFVRNDGAVGLGTSSPSARLHVVDGTGSGGTPVGNSTIVMEKNGASYFQIITPDANENGIFFGIASLGSSGGIIYNPSGLRKGFEFRTGGNNTRLRIDSTGRLALGNFAPTHKLHLNVDDAAKPSTSTWTIVSDARLKTNVSDFKEGLDVVKKIRPVWFEYNGKAGLPTGEKSIGILAQEMQKLAPYMIGKFKQTDDAGVTNEYLDYNANALFYILVNSVKELSVQNDKKDDRIDALENEVAQLKTMMQMIQQNLSRCSPCAVTESGGQSSAMNNELSVMSTASLSQDIPNPFNHTTTINYTLPPKYSAAKVIVIDKSGKVLKEVSVSGKSKGTITVDASTLAAGAYNYSLIVDGKLIDTKQMALAK